MNPLTNLITYYGDVIQLDFPRWNVSNSIQVLQKHPGWVRYQPHKPDNNRYGLSVTSYDGGLTGEPDLYSLKEYNNMHGTQYNESDFKKRTNIVNHIPELNPFLDFFGPSLGRTHFIKLNSGGFFPPHRDNGLVLHPATFRILVPIQNFGINDMKWLQEEKPLYLELGSTYFINTQKPHSVFSFVNNCIMLVLNIIVDQIVIEKLIRKIVPI